MNIIIIKKNSLSSLLSHLSLTSLSLSRTTKRAANQRFQIESHHQTDQTNQIKNLLCLKNLCLNQTQKSRVIGSNQTQKSQKMTILAQPKMTVLRRRKLKPNPEIQCHWIKRPNDTHCDLWPSAFHGGCLMSSNL